VVGNFIQLLTVLLLGSCNFINPEEQIPTYIKVDSVIVNTNADEGTAAHKIKDVWAYMDGEFIGVFELPAKFPVLGSQGNHSFLFAPGIYDNGIASTHIIYRLMHGASMDINLVNGATVAPPSTPKITYFPEVTFSWMEDFESGSISLIRVSGDTLVQDATDKYEGAYSGKIALNAADPSFNFEMFSGVSIPTTSVSYLEMHYKCDHPFFVGLAGKKSGTYVPVTISLINASPEWNKIYISLGAAVRALSPSTDYKLFINSSISSGTTTGNFHFDNFKIVHN